MRGAQVASRIGMPRAPLGLASSLALIPLAGQLGRVPYDPARRLLTLQAPPPARVGKASLSSPAACLECPERR